MKKIYTAKILMLFIVSFLISISGNSQVLISNSSGTADESSMLEIESSSKGLLIPRMTTTQRQSISNPKNGLLVYDINKGSFYLYGRKSNGTLGWNDLSTPAGIWETDASNVYLSGTYTNVGIGTSSPNSKFVVQAEVGDDPTAVLFEVKDELGNPIFKVTSEGVRVFVKDTASGKGITGGFAVGRYGTAKGFPDTTYFSVTPFATKVNTVMPKTKGIAGGFAVGRYGTAKAPTTTFFSTNPDSTRVYSNVGTKGISGGFAVGRYGTAKGEDSLVFFTSKDSTRVYTESAAKGITGGFAVGRYGTAKGPKDNYLFMVPDNYLIGHQSGERLQTGNYSGKFNTFFGYQSGNSDTIAGSNVFIGYKSGFSTEGQRITSPSVDTLGSRNVFLGYESGYSNTTGTDNVLLGYQSGYHITTAINNISIGSQAGYGHTVSGNYGDNNIFMGTKAGFSNRSGAANVFIGEESGYSNISGNSNIFIGYFAGNKNDGSLGLQYGNNNVFVGNGSGADNVSGYENVFVGTLSGNSNTDGTNNVFVGFNTGESNQSGYDNTFIGTQSGKNLSSGIENTFLGCYAGLNATGGNQNIFIGVNSGQYQSAGNNNIYLGNSAGSGTSSVSNQGQENIFIGSSSGKNNQEGENNVFLGNLAGYSNIGNPSLYQGGHNVYVGFRTAYENVIGYGNVYLGMQAGEKNRRGSNVLIGQYAGQNDTIGESNVIIGAQSALSKQQGNHNVIIGNAAGAKTEDGEYNVFIGKSAAWNYNGTNGSNSLNSNVVIGFAASFYGVGTNNVILGYQAGYNLTPTTSTGNVLIGYRAGREETGSNKLYIDNSATTAPLLLGDFSANTLQINGTLTFNAGGNSVTLPSVRGTAGYVLTTDAAGGTSWTSKNANADITTADNGLTEVSDQIRLGGSLIADTEVTLGVYNLNLNASGTGNVGIGVTAPLVELDVRGKVILGNGLTPSTTEDDNLVNIMSGSSSDGGLNGITFWENNAGFGMGIGYDGTGSSDQNKLCIYDDADVELIAFENGGNVGIGVAVPGDKLEVKGDVIVGSGTAGYDGSSEHIRIASQNETWYLGSRNESAVGSSDFFIGQSDLEDGIFHIQNDGDVGIGTFSPSVKLHTTLSGGSLPSLLSGTVALFQNNSLAADISSIAIIGGASGSSRLNFGDSGDDEAGSIAYTHASNLMLFRMSNQNRMTINVAGDVGIGTISPGDKLEVKGDVIIGSGTTGYDGSSEHIQIASQNETWYLGARNETTATNSDFFIGQGDTEDGIFLIENDGDVGIGTNYPTEKLDVEGNINANQNAFCVTLMADGVISAGDVIIVSSSTDLRVVRSGTTIGDEHVIGVAVSGAIGAGRPVTFAVGGAVQVTVDNTVTRGDFLETSSVAGRVRSSGTTGGYGDFGIALEGGVQGDLIWMIFKKAEGI